MMNNRLIDYFKTLINKSKLHCKKYVPILLHSLTPLMCHLIPTHNVSIITKLCANFNTINVYIFYFYTIMCQFFRFCVLTHLLCKNWHNMWRSLFNTIMCHIEHNMCNFWHIRFYSVDCNDIDITEKFQSCQILIENK